MGYYTRHELEVIGDEAGIDHESQISAKADYDYLFDGEEVKWYSHEEDMREYSRDYPELIFKLSGEGEESGDFWVEYHQNGKMQRGKAKIVFEEFDASKLI